MVPGGGCAVSSKGLLSVPSEADRAPAVGVAILERLRVASEGGYLTPPEADRDRSAPYTGRAGAAGCTTTGQSVMLV
jgi:hypothetical protein